MKTILFALLFPLFLAGCNQHKCVDGKVAVKLGDAWVIPEGASRCVPYEKSKP